MLITIFGDKPGFILANCLSALVALLVAAKVAKHKQAKAPWAIGILCALVVIELSVTLLLPGAGAADGICYLNRRPAGIFMTSQGLMNIAMFAPIGFFAVAATRSPLISLAGGATLSIATEFAQATIFGRNCDSNDFAANSIGALIGVGLFCAVSALSRHRSHLWKSGMKPAAVLVVATAVAAGVAINTVITPIALDDSSMQISSPAQERAARDAMRRAFDEHVDIDKVTLSPGANGAQDQLIISFPNGLAQLSWPVRNEFSALLEPESNPGEYSFALDPPASPPKRDRGAQEIATKYAEDRYPKQLKGATAKTFPVGEEAEFGWITSWRTIQDGVLMPKRLDVQVNRAGRISQLVVREFSEDCEIPRNRIDKEAAMNTVEKELGIRPDAASEHLLKKDGKYQPVWVVAIEHSADDIESVFVDSLHRRIIDNIPGVSGDLETVPGPDTG
ncbi:MULTISPECIES: VanZ family protein [Streptomyces]|uniref:VanZ family protein n=1 Tax=Streptomyces TaxID=1883 RepID=UPI00131AD9BD|nr:VanZ family protein [Streptomyces sp. NRRL F-6628]